MSTADKRKACLCEAEILKEGDEQHSSESRAAHTSVSEQNDGDREREVDCEQKGNPPCLVNHSTPVEGRKVTYNLSLSHTYKHYHCP